MAENTIQWDKDADGIVTLTLDDPTGSANVMNEHYTESMHNAVERLIVERDSITGVVITSAKKTFFAGGDLKAISRVTLDDEAEFFSTAEAIKGDLRALEKLEKPVVAAINGAALGGGLEIALACNHRIAADAKGVVIGLPEVTLGLLPCGGGVVRSVRHSTNTRPCSNRRDGRRDCLEPNVTIREETGALDAKRHYSVERAFRLETNGVGS